MKVNRGIIEKYNQPGSILVVSSYPEKGVKYSGKVCAVGGFAKNTLASLRNEYQAQGEKRNFIVLTVTTNGKQEVYEENGILVIRCLKRDDVFSYFSFLRYAILFNQVKEVLAEFEFASFGGVLMTGLLPFILGMLRVFGKRIVLVVHQVVFDLNQLTGHVGFRKNSWKLRFFQTGLKLFYQIMCLPAEKIVVLEKEFKNRLVKLVNPEKIAIIPHGVDNSLRLVNKSFARKKLGIKRDEKVLLYFGYLAWYKGIDKLLEIVNKKGIKLIVAGGASFTQKKKPHYQQYLSRVRLLAKEKNVQITGFLPEDKIKLYFSAADLVVLPYRTFMSSSGPLSLTLSHGKPFIISQPMANILETIDFKESLASLGLKKSDVIFQLTKNSLGKKLERIGKTGPLEKLSVMMREKRNFENLSADYLDILGKKEAPIGLFKGKISPAFRLSKTV